MKSEQIKIRFLKKSPKFDPDLLTLEPIKKDKYGNISYTNCKINYNNQKGVTVLLPAILTNGIREVDSRCILPIPEFTSDLAENPSCEEKYKKVTNFIKELQDTLKQKISKLVENMTEQEAKELNIKSATLKNLKDNSFSLADIFSENVNNQYKNQKSFILPIDLEKIKTKCFTSKGEELDPEEIIVKKGEQKKVNVQLEVNFNNVMIGGNLKNSDAKVKVFINMLAAEPITIAPSKPEICDFYNED